MKSVFVITLGDIVGACLLLLTVAVVAVVLGTDVIYRLWRRRKRRRGEP